MTLRLEDKKAIVAEVNAVASSAISVVAADYCGLTVSEMTGLRAEARKTGVQLRVVRNTLSRRALAGTQFECLTEKLVGPLFLAFSEEDPGAAARLLKNFGKEHEALEVKALSIDGKLLDGSELSVLASLPTYDEAIAKLMSVIEGPTTKFVRTLAEPHSKLVRTIAAIRDKKQAEAA